jgi:hypothetical protein
MFKFTVQRTYSHNLNLPLTYSNTCKCVKSECSTTKRAVRHTHLNLGNPSLNDCATSIVIGSDFDVSIAASEIRHMRTKLTIVPAIVIRL